MRLLVNLELVIYLTYNDQPSGIYASQVIGVVKYLNSIQDKEQVKLVALISARNFSKNKKLIKEKLSDSLVLPMVPKAGLWRLNYFLLFFVFLFSSHKKIMARGPFATVLSIWIKKTGLVSKVIFDGRGAYKAELNEYDVIKDEKVKRQIGEIEKHVILNSDFRLAVSDSLVEYWKSEYGYTDKRHIVIPCTLNQDFSFDFPPEKDLKQIREKAGYTEDDLVIIYSGSSAGWQSFALIEKVLTGWMKQDQAIKLLWLTNQSDENSSLVKQFKDRIKKAWVNPGEVKNYLLAGDHGLLYREDKMTNRVASPVKFAEYLYCGLQVIISDHLGDFSEFVRNHGCGSVDANCIPEKPDYAQKKKNHLLARQYLSKEAYKMEYLKLFLV